MTPFSDGLDAVILRLGRAGYHTLREPIDISAISSDDMMIDCEVIARNDQYQILYMETESNWRSIARSVAEKQDAPCLVVTKYDDSFIMTTVQDKMTRHPKTRHIVISPDSEKYSLSEFVRLIKSTPEDDHVSIDERVQAVFDAFSRYDEAIKRFGENLEDVISDTRDLISSRTAGSERYKRESAKFVAVCKEILNDTIGQSDITAMLIQHIVTARIFAMVYDYDFYKNNSIARELERLRSILGISDTLIDYSSIELVAESITDNEGRQRFIRDIYETFYKKYDPRRVSRDGIVYTPTEIIDFILNSVQYVLKTEFETDFSDRAVKVLDPFTGTGTFLARLLESGMLGGDLAAKYQNDIFANELLLLAFYIATVNIESAYASTANSEHIPFEGMNYTDTIEMDPRYLEGEHRRQEDAKIDKQFVDIRKRRQKQRKSNLNVIIGNPPYSAGQKNANDDNKNVRYPEIEKRIKDTYIKKAPKGNTRQMYNSYIKSLRWASDRLGESGIIGFIMPSAWITGNAEAGIRACLEEEFTDVWCFDLRGDVKKADWRKEGDKIFGSGSTVGVAIIILVKNPKNKGCTIRYKDIGDCLSRKDKLQAIRKYESVNGIRDWMEITPDRYNDWLNQRELTHDDWTRHSAMGSKEGKAGKTDSVLFAQYSLGLATHRDRWVYNTSRIELKNNMKRHIDYCNSQDPDNFIKDPKHAMWNAELSVELKKLRRQGTAPKLDDSHIRTASFRPFFKQYLYFDPVFIAAKYRIPSFFPHADSKNLAIVVPDKIKGQFSAHVTDITPDLHIHEASQTFPLRAKNDIGRDIRPTVSRLQTPDSRLQTPDSRLQTPDSRLQTPDSRLQTPDSRLIENLAIIVPDKTKGEFSTFITNLTPDLEIVHHGQVFPMKVME